MMAFDAKLREDIRRRRGGDSGGGGPKFPPLPLNFVIGEMVWRYKESVTHAIENLEEFHKFCSGKGWGSLDEKFMDDDGVLRGHIEQVRVDIREMINSLGKLHHAFMRSSITDGHIQIQPN